MLYGSLQLSCFVYRNHRTMLTYLRWSNHSLLCSHIASGTTCHSSHIQYSFLCIPWALQRTQHHISHEENPPHFLLCPCHCSRLIKFFFYHGDSLSSSPQPFDLSSKHVKRGHKLKLIANLHILKMLFSFSVSLDENLNFPIKQVACMGRKKCCLLFLNITFRSDLVKCQINMGNWKKSKPKIRRIRVWMALFKP